MWFIGAAHYDIRVNGASSDRARLSDVTLQNLDPGLFYDVQIFSIGIRNRLSEEGSDVIRIQTSKYKFAYLVIFFLAKTLL